METKKILGPIYLLTILFLPTLVFGGWLMFFMMPFIIVISFLLSIFVVRKFYKNVDWSFKYVLALLALYVFACLAVVDGGDGDGYLGLERLIYNITLPADQAFRVEPTLVPDVLRNVSGEFFHYFFIIFGILSLVFIFFPRRKGAIPVPAVESSSNRKYWLITFLLIVVLLRVLPIYKVLEELFGL